MEKQIGPWSQNLQNIPPTSFNRNDFNQIPAQFRRTLKIAKKMSDPNGMATEKIKLPLKGKQNQSGKGWWHDKSEFSIPKIETPRKEDLQKMKVNSHSVKQSEIEKHGIKKKFKPKQFYLQMINFRRRYSRQTTPETKMMAATNYKKLRATGIKQFNLFK